MCILPFFLKASLGLTMSERKTLYGPYRLENKSANPGPNCPSPPRK